MTSKRILKLVAPTLVVLFASVFLFTPIAYAQGVENARPLSVNKQMIEQQIIDNEQKLALIGTTNGSVEEMNAKKGSLNTQLEAEKQRITQLKNQIAKKKAVRNAVYTASATVNSAPVANCGDNGYASYIYGKESGCRTTAMNPRGCYGIGQACPGSKVAQCGADYACQNAWFTNYAIQRYGSWANAYNFHRANGWW